jgi:hypothetical protein
MHRWPHRHILHRWYYIRFCDPYYLNITLLRTGSQVSKLEPCLHPSMTAFYGLRLSKHRNKMSNQSQNGSSTNHKQAIIPTMPIKRQASNERYTPLRPSRESKFAWGGGGDPTRNTVLPEVEEVTCGSFHQPQLGVDRSWHPRYV